MATAAILLTGGLVLSGGVASAATPGPAATQPVKAAGAATSTTVTVLPAAMGGWGFVDDNTNGAGTGKMVVGPGTPPAGLGSAQLVATTSTDRQTLVNSAYKTTSLASVTALDFWSSPVGPYLGFDVGYQGANTKTYEGRLTSVPKEIPSAGHPGWQHWDALAGTWYATDTTSNGSNGLCPATAPCTTAEVMTNWTSASIVYNLVLKVGGVAGWPAGTYNVDALTVGVSGSNTTYDFEAPIAPVFTADSPPMAVSGAAYSYTFAASGVPAPTFSLASGTLPAGLMLNAATGELSGTPTGSGTFTVTASSSSGAATTGSITITASVASGGAAAATPSGDGYWSLTGGGTLSAHGNAVNLGSENGVALNAPVVAVSSTSSGNGYWLAGSDGGVFTFGDAGFHGSLGATTLNRPIVGMARTLDNGGYSMVGADGGIFTFGDAAFYGSLGATKLNQPIVGMNPTPDGKGYWLAAADGGVFTFGNAKFFGSLGAINLNKGVVGMAFTPDAKGYWLVAADGGVFTFGDAKFYGSLGGSGTVQIAGIVANGNDGYRLIDSQGNAHGFGTNP